MEKAEGQQRKAYALRIAPRALTPRVKAEVARNEAISQPILTNSGQTPLRALRSNLGVERTQTFYRINRPLKAEDNPPDKGKLG